jgi:hypothetical protein
MQARRSVALLAAPVALSAAITFSGTARSASADGLFGTILPNG